MYTPIMIVEAITEIVPRQRRSSPIFGPTNSTRRISNLSAPNLSESAFLI